MSEEEYTAVRVTNVSKVANDDIISSFFSFCGEILSIDIHDSSDSPDTNEVIITFGTHDAAKMAEVLSNTDFLDKNIVITPYIKNPGSATANNENTTKNTTETEDTTESNENVASTTEPTKVEDEEKKEDNDGCTNASSGDKNVGDDDDDDDDDGKEEAKSDATTPSSSETEGASNTASTNNAKEGTSDGKTDNKKDEKEDAKDSQKEDMDENGNPDGRVVHKLGEVMADGYLIKEDLKKYDEALGISEGIKSSAAAIDNTLGLSSAFNAATSFVGSQLKGIDQQTGISQAAGKLMEEVSESPYFASTFSLFRGWGASITKAYNAVCKESTSILEEKKASDGNTDGTVETKQ